MRAFLLTLLFLCTTPLWAQIPGQYVKEFDDDLGPGSGGDIFTDFNEDLEASQVLEDERFYRYGRFFSVNLGIGTTGFFGNRGAAYQSSGPSFHLSTNYFFNFLTSFQIGLEYSKHVMFIDTLVAGHENKNLGAVETNLLRPFVAVRRYIDTSDLGTALTYANPYFSLRFEYWYQTNKFIEREDIQDQSGGGIGMGFGGGFEFPIELKKSYVNVEFLYHSVNFFDQFTNDYQQITDSNGEPIDGSKYGYPDLTGDVFSVMISYVINW